MVVNGRGGWWWQVPGICGGCCVGGERVVFVGDSGGGCWVTYIEWQVDRRYWWLVVVVAGGDGR